MITRLNIETRKRCELIEITGEVERVVKGGRSHGRSGRRIFPPHHGGDYDK